MVIASTLSILAFFGLFGRYAEAFSTFIAAGLALVLCPLVAWATKGTYYLASPIPVWGYPRAEGSGGGQDVWF
jgi:hypothetical protein